MNPKPVRSGKTHIGIEVDVYVKVNYLSLAGAPSGVRGAAGSQSPLGGNCP
jgi:hypothetical protein